ncbi:response regulator transcription factor [Pedobacter sp.]|uniref:response regulator transcription factor n=1 Tax=Pedobacter sp. TaxID=1411316 RepID=UPI0031D69A1E
MQKEMSPISIAIAEDQPLALQSILKKLRNNSILQIVFTAINGLDLLEKLQEQMVDVVLMDIEMPIMEGITATHGLKEKYPDTKVLILTTFDDDDKIFNAILAGASGYLLKDESPETISKSIFDIHHGGAAMSPGIALKTLNHIKHRSQNPAEQISASTANLSAREMEILTALKDGLAYKQIADGLFISEGTVRKHIEHIYRKLQVNNKVSAVNIARANKWL